MTSYSIKTISAGPETTTFVESLASESAFSGRREYDFLPPKKSNKKRIIFIVLGILFGLLLVFGLSKLLISKKKEVKLPPAPPFQPIQVQDGMEIWEGMNSNLEYPEGFAITLENTYPNHRPEHPYFVITNDDELREHLVLTGTAAVNTLPYLPTEWQAQVFPHLRNIIYMYGNSSPYQLQSSLKMLDLQLILNHLENHYRGGVRNNDAFLNELSEFVDLIEELPGFLKSQYELCKEAEKSAKGNKDLKKLFKRDAKMIKVAMKTADKASGRLGQLVVQRYSNLLQREDSGRFQKYLGKKKLKSQYVTKLKKQTKFVEKNVVAAPLARALLLYGQKTE